VLVVDDDEDWRALIADVLAGEGFLVSTAGDGRAALAYVRRMRPEVVVTDVEMPFMDGCELLARVRSLDRTLPVIVLTAAISSDERFVFPDAFRVICKPVTTDVVVRAVREAALCHRLPRGVLARTANLFRQTKVAECPTVSRRRRRGRLAVAAGFGMAAAAALVIAAIRGLAA
jgi:DNA-binding response OmpR family regulator